MQKFHMIMLGRRLLDSITGEDGGGNGSSETPAASTEEGSGVDDFGYAIPKAPVEPPKEGTPPAKAPEQSATPPNEEIPPGTGYGVEPPKAPAAPPAPAAEPPKIELPYELEAKDLDVVEVNKIKTFAKENNLTKEAAQALLNLKKSEFETMKKEDEKWVADQKTAVIKQRGDWHNELKSDASFGGEKFAFNIAQAEKVLHEFLPDTKKALTQRGSVLPPYVMRDLAKLAAKLYGAEKFVPGGDPAPVETPVENPDAHLDFYSPKK